MCFVVWARAGVHSLAGSSGLPLQSSKNASVLALGAGRGAFFAVRARGRLPTKSSPPAPTATNTPPHQQQKNIRTHQQQQNQVVDAGGCFLLCCGCVILCCLLDGPFSQLLASQSFSCRAQQRKSTRSRTKSKTFRDTCSFFWMLLILLHTRK